MINGSVWHDSIWKQIGFEKYPRTLKLIEGIRSRPEFRGVIANPKPWREFIAKAAEKPPGERV